MSSMRNRIAAFLAVAVVFLSPAAAQARTKNNSAKQNGLADYVQRVSAKAPDSAPTTLGSLWNDSGRLANMVADYKASRVGDLVTISVAQNLSATSTGNVSTNRTFSASSDNSKPRAWRTCFLRAQHRCCPEKQPPPPRLR
jgi:flagellar basal body L-ring protein FlgH